MHTELTKPLSSGTSAPAHCPCPLKGTQEENQDFVFSMLQKTGASEGQPPTLSPIPQDLTPSDLLPT